MRRDFLLKIKNTEEVTLSGKRTHIGRTSGEIIIKITPKEQSHFGLNSQVKGRRNCAILIKILFFYFYCIILLYLIFRGL